MPWKYLHYIWKILKLVVNVFQFLFESLRSIHKEVMLAVLSILLIDPKLFSINFNFLFFFQGENQAKSLNFGIRLLVVYLLIPEWTSFANFFYTKYRRGKEFWQELCKRIIFIHIQKLVVRIENTITRKCHLSHLSMKTILSITLICKLRESRL